MKACIFINERLNSFQKCLLQTLLLGVSLLIAAGETEKPKATVTRTELKVSRSLNPEDTQTLNVMTRDGSVAQLIVKKRDPKTKSSIPKPSPTPATPEVILNNHFPRSIYTNWIPVSSVYLQPNIIRLDAFAKNNNTDFKSVKISNVIDSDR